MSYLKTWSIFLLSILIISCDADPISIEEDPPQNENDNQGQNDEDHTAEIITWENEGLDDVYVHTVAHYGNYLFTATDDGVYKALVEDPLDWQNIGLGSDTTKVSDLIALNDQEILASVQYDTIRQNDKVLFKTEDRGNSWTGWALDVPDHEDHENRVSHLAVNRQNPDIIYAISLFMIRSENGGQTWERVFSGAANRFLYVSKEFPNQIWTGGSLPILQPFLAKSADGGDEWEHLSSNIRRTGGQIFNAIISPENEDIVLISSGEKSTDGGNTWEDNLDLHVQAFQVSNSNPERVYASTTTIDNTLFITVSDDFGDTWEIKKSEDGDLPEGMRVQDMALVTVNGHDVLYIATNQGMISYTHDEDDEGSN